jgi:hypothetical protein
MLITQDTQEQLAAEINLEFAKLAALLEEDPAAYKATYEINKRVVTFIDNARLLQSKPKEMVDL